MQKKKTLRRVFLLFTAVLLLLSMALMTSCGKEETDESGHFSSLWKAYQSKWLTEEDVRNIAYYYHASSGRHFDEGYEPTPKEPETLNAETEAKIKADFWDEIIKSAVGKPEDWLETTHITDYYGSYGNCIAVNIECDTVIIDSVMEAECEIGGVVFYNFISGNVRIWREAED